MKKASPLEAYAWPARALDTPARDSLQTGRGDYGSAPAMTYGGRELHAATRGDLRYATGKRGAQGAHLGFGEDLERPADGRRRACRRRRGSTRVDLHGDELLGLLLVPHCAQKRNREGASKLRDERVHTTEAARRRI